MACLRESLSPAERTVYKYSLGLDIKPIKINLIVLSPSLENGASIEESGDQQKFLRLLPNENESIATWETGVRNQAAQCEYEDFADELMRDQFIGGLTSEALRVNESENDTNRETADKRKLRYEKLSKLPRRSKRQCSRISS